MSEHPLNECQASSKNGSTNTTSLKTTNLFHHQRHEWRNHKSNALLSVEIARTYGLNGLAVPIAIDRSPMSRCPYRLAPEWHRASCSRMDRESSQHFQPASDRDRVMIDLGLQGIPESARGVH